MMADIHSNIVSDDLHCGHFKLRDFNLIDVLFLLSIPFSPFGVLLVVVNTVLPKIESWETWYLTEELYKLKEKFSLHLNLVLTGLLHCSSEDTY